MSVLNRSWTTDPALEKKFKTKVYTDHDIKEPYLFDLSLDKKYVDTSDMFKTKFMLKQGEGDEEKFGENQFLQFKLYDHSRYSIVVRLHGRIWS